MDSHRRAILVDRNARDIYHFAVTKTDATFGNILDIILGGCKNKKIDEIVRDTYLEVHLHISRGTFSLASRKIRVGAKQPS